MEDPRLERALERALDEPEALASLRLSVECQGDAGLRSMRVYGTGVGVWKERSQFRLTRRQLDEMVRALLKGGFSALEETYGEQEEDTVTMEICEVNVAVAGTAKAVTQLAQGEQSPVLAALAERLLALGAAAAESGVTATSLRDGLEKVARGELAPEVWLVSMQRRAETGQPPKEPGLLLKIAAGRATVRPFAASGGWGEPLEMDLAAPALRALAGELATSGLERWPVNLYAVDYVDVVVRVLNHEKSVQARQFSGMDPARNAPQQAELEAVLGTLAGIAQQVLASGRPVPARERK